MSSWTQFPSENDRLFFRQLETIFLEYPPSVTAAVTHPLTGMQRKPEYEKRPSIAAIVAELNREKLFFDARAEEHKGRRLIREENMDRSGRPTLEELAARHPDMEWAQRILVRSQRNAPLTKEQRLAELNEFRGRTGLPPLTQAEFDAIPDAKSNWKPPSLPSKPPADDPLKRTG